MAEEKMNRSRKENREEKEAKKFIDKLLHLYLDERENYMDQDKGVLILDDELDRIKYNLNHIWITFVKKWNKRKDKLTKTTPNKFSDSVKEFDEKVRVSIWITYTDAVMKTHYKIEYDQKELFKLYESMKHDPWGACYNFVFGHDGPVKVSKKVSILDVQSNNKA